MSAKRPPPPMPAHWKNALRTLLTLGALVLVAVVGLNAALVLIAPVSVRSGPLDGSLRHVQAAQAPSFELAPQPQVVAVAR